MRTSVFLFLPFFVACTEAAVTKFNANPTAVITSHVDGDTVQEGEPELLLGQVGDADNDATDLSITWTVGDAEVCTDTVPEADGAVSCEASFGEAGGTVILAVSDPAGAGASATVDLEVQLTDAPVANLSEPTSTGKYYAEQTITFEGTVSDTEDAPEDLTVTIETDALGDLGMDIDVNSEGDVNAFGLLPEGEHAVVIRVVDTSGKEGNDNVVITVGPENSAPTCAITAPEDGTSGPEGEDVRFEGTVNDVDVPANELSASWASDIDGPLRETTPDSDGSVGFATNELSINTHRITLTVTDALDEACTTSIYYTVSNTAPEMGLVSITPDAGQVGDTLTCTASATDPDGDALTIAYSWDDGTIGNTYSITEANNPGDTLTCTATVSDADGATDSGTATALVENTEPTIDSIAVTPDTAPADSMATCAATASDADGDTPTITYSWSDGSEGEAVAIPATAIDGDTFTCTATATDSDGGTATATATVTVTNNAPVVESVSIAPDPAYNDDTLTCSASVTDADGETPSVAYAWSVGTTSAVLSLTSSMAAPGDTLTCTVTASDSEGATDVGSATITIQNRAPTITVDITPEPPNKNDTLVCSATGVGDADDDPTSLEWTWTVDGVTTSATASTADTSSLEDVFEPGQIVTCTGTVNDGHGATTSDTVSVSILNTAPVVADVVLSPTEVYTNDIITASADITDAEGDLLDVTYRFFVGVDMVQEGSSNSLDGSIHFDKGDAVYAAVMADDGVVTHTEISSTLTVLNTPPTAASISIVDAGGSCPAGWESMADEARCVRVFAESTTWTAASDRCNDHDGELVSVLSEADNDQIFELTSGFDTDAVWIGLNDIESEGIWSWAAGNTLSYTNWFTGEPNGGPSENCVELFHDGATPVVHRQWNDKSCDHLTSGYACQLEIGGLTCAIDEESTDADGDPITYAFDWDVDGDEYMPVFVPPGGVHEGDTIPGEALGGDETWTCEVTPDDGEDLGPMASASLYLEAIAEELPESELSYSVLSVPGDLQDHAVSADGSTRVLSKSGDRLYLYCFAPDGSLERGDIDVGDAGIFSTNSFAVFMSRISKHTMVAWRRYSSTHEELRYVYLDADCNTLVPESAIWTHDYVEFFDVALDDRGRGVVAYGQGGTHVAWIDSDGTIIGTETPFHIGAGNGTHVAMNPSTGAGIVASQIHSGDGIYYQRFNSGFEWVDSSPVWMPAGYHYWYDGFTVGMNDNNEFAFLWVSDETTIEMAFYNADGSRVAEVVRSMPTYGAHDVFRRRHSEIPLNGENFVFGEVYNYSFGAGTEVRHFEYTPSGEFVSEGSTTHSVNEGLTIRTDGWGNAVVRDASTVMALYSYP